MAVSNSGNYRNIPVYVNVENASIVENEQPYEAVSRTDQLPSVFCGETVIFHFYLIDSEGHPVPVEQNDQFELSIDADFIHENDTLMAYSGHDMVNLPGDWDGASADAGQLAVRVSCNTDTFVSKLGGTESMNVWLELRRFHGSEHMSELLCYRIRAKNVVHLTENQPDPSDVNYYTASQVDAKIASLAASIPSCSAGYGISETDGVFSLDDSVAALKTDLADYLTLSQAETGYVAQEAGKVLSSNDYTDADASKVALLQTTGTGSQFLGDDGNYHALEGSSSGEGGGSTGYTAGNGIVISGSEISVAEDVALKTDLDGYLKKEFASYRPLVMHPVFYTESDGFYALLNETTFQLQTETVWQVQTLLLRVMSEDGTSTGNAVLSAGTESWILPVTQAAVWHKLELNTPYSGLLQLEADMENASWTLKDASDSKKGIRILDLRIQESWSGL